MDFAQGAVNPVMSQFSNAGIVTLTAGGATVVALQPFVCNPGEFVQISCHLNCTKGATPGDTFVSVSWIVDSGAFTILGSGIQYARGVAASAQVVLYSYNMFKCNTAGQFRVQMGGTSAGSNSSVPANQGNMMALYFRTQ